MTALLPQNLMSVIHLECRQFLCERHNAFTFVPDAVNEKRLHKCLCIANTCMLHGRSRFAWLLVYGSWSSAPGQRLLAISAGIIVAELRIVIHWTPCIYIY